MPPKDGKGEIKDRSGRPESHAYVDYRKVVDELRAKRQALIHEAAVRLAPALNAYLGAERPQNVHEARELVKSVGEDLRDLDLAVCGKGPDREKPCLLVVDIDTKYSNVPRYRLQMRYPGESNVRYSRINDKTYTLTLSDVLPLGLMQRQPFQGLVRWADRGINSGGHSPNTR